MTAASSATMLASSLSATGSSPPVHIALRASPSVAREVLARLEEELQECLAAKGPTPAGP
jgi:hypothetical protein